MTTLSACTRFLVILFALATAGCSVFFPPSPKLITPAPNTSPTGARSFGPTLLPTADFTSSAVTAIPQVDSPTSAPAVTATATPAPVFTPTLPPSGFSLLVNPDLLWSIRYPAARFGLETLSDGTVVLRTGDRTAFVAVTSYKASGNEYGTNGETLRTRAREAVQRVLGKPAKSASAIQSQSDLLETGIAFTTDDGFTGEALYGQRGRVQKDWRVYGFILGYKTGTDPRLVTVLKAMRDSLLAVTVTPLNVAGGSRPLTFIASRGLRGFNSQVGEGHFVGIFTRETAWREVSHVDLQNGDYVDPQGVQQVQVEPSHLWFTIESGVGAHGGCFELISFDSQTLRSEAAHCQSSAGAGFLRDLKGDGIPELVFNETEYYVFAYAAGVRRVDYQVLRLNGGSWTQVKLAKLPDSASADLRTLTNRAVDLAQGELWQDAQTTIDQAVGLNASDPTVLWDSAIIHLISDARAQQASSGAYPLLDNLFAGDYVAALGALKTYSAAQLFTPRSPAVVGTAAQGSEISLRDWIVKTTTAALQARPDLAAAYFIRGWGIYQGSPGTAKAQADMSKAAQLDPKEALYSSSLALLKTAVLPPLANRERIQFGPGATAATVNTNLTANVPKGYVVRAGAKQNMVITATNKATVVVLDAQDNRQGSGSEEPGAWQGMLPQAGDYTIVLFGQGAVTLTVKITQ